MMSSSAMQGAPVVQPPILKPEAEKQERLQLMQVTAAFRYYHTECYLTSLSHRQQDMLAKYRSHCRVIRDCIDKNQQIFTKMLRSNFELTENGISCNNGTEGFRCSKDDDVAVTNARDYDKVQSTLKLIARDWSAVGEEERAQAYKPIIDTIVEYFKPEDHETNEIKILVPGAGLGRLAYEIACLGYECEGNEFSYFMLISSNYLLNECTEAKKYTLFPWIHQYVNNLRMCDQVASISFPDICPAQNPPKGNLSMSAGDFLEVYTEPNVYDCVATSFFIDCANNVIDFIERIYQILIPGGIWVNLGPLLYHYSDLPHENSIEPTYENLVLIIEMVGFEILRTETGIRTKYAQNPQSMLKCEYESLFWICRKKRTTDNADDSTSPFNSEQGSLRNDSAPSRCSPGYFSP